MREIKLIMLASTFIFTLAKASEVNRETLFELEKNINYENVLVVHTLINEDCRFQEFKDNQGHIDYYWLINKNNKKKKSFEKSTNIHGKKVANKNLLFKNMNENQSAFEIELKNLDNFNLKHDLKDPVVKIEAFKSEGKCRTRAIANLGDRNNPFQLEVQSIYTEFFTDSAIRLAFAYLRGNVRVNSVVLKGINLESGENVEVPIGVRPLAALSN